MHCQIVIKWVWRCTWRPWSCELGGHNWATSEMHLEAVIEQVWRYTWMPWSSDFGDALAGYDRARLEEYLEAVEERCAGWWDFIHLLVNSQPWECDDVTLHLKLLWRPGWWRSICREARQKLRLSSLVSWLTTVGMWRGNFTFEALSESWLVAVNREGRHAGS